MLLNCLSGNMPTWGPCPTCFHVALITRTYQLPRICNLFLFHCFPRSRFCVISLLCLLWADLLPFSLQLRVTNSNFWLTLTKLLNDGNSIIKNITEQIGLAIKLFGRWWIRILIDTLVITDREFWWICSVPSGKFWDSTSNSATTTLFQIISSSPLINK